MGHGSELLQARDGGSVAIRKRRIFALVAAGLVAAGALAVVLVVVTNGRKPVARADQSATGLSSAQVTRLERGLMAPGIAGQARVLAAEVRAQFIARGQRLLPARSQVKIQPTSFDVRSAQTATVDASVSGPASGRWQLLLIKEAGNWLLIGTRRLG